MSMESTMLERFVAIEGKRGVSVEWLGSLTWFTISESVATESQIAAAFDAAGIDTQYIPPLAHPKDAMRRAVKAAEVARQEIGPEQYLNLLAREVSHSKTDLLYHLVAEVVDAKGHRLSYSQEAEITLHIETDKKGAFTREDIATHWLPSRTSTGPVLSEAAKALGGIQAAYNQHRTHYDGNALRRTVTRILDDCHPVAVRPSGGVLFIPRGYAATVDALGKLIDLLAQYGITQGHRSVLRAVPVVDAADQRQMIDESLEEQVNTETRALLDDLSQADGSTKKGIETLIGRIQRLQSMVREYDDLLETKRSDAQAGLEVAMAQARALLAD